jgi:hypothetical protein
MWDFLAVDFIGEIREKLGLIEKNFREILAFLLAFSPPVGFN